jgi:hypothetical protein
MRPASTVASRDQNRVPPPNWKNWVRSYGLFQERIGEIETQRTERRIPDHS